MVVSPEVSSANLEPVMLGHDDDGVDETIAEDFRNDENFLEIMTLQINSLCIYAQAHKGGLYCYF